METDSECRQLSPARFLLLEFPWGWFDFNIRQGGTCISGQVATTVGVVRSGGAYFLCPIVHNSVKIVF